MKSVILLLALAFPLSFLGATEVEPFKTKKYCPKSPRITDIPDVQSFLKENNIIPMGSIEAPYLNQFLNEFQRFPAELTEKMLKEGAKIHLIQGKGVSDDPTWDYGTNTVDGRFWSFVPGSGGVPWLKTPTRIVVNHLYDQHAATNLFLHEHAHTLDALYKGRRISRSAGWLELYRKESTKRFLKVLCSSYCTESSEEGFAELFAYYHGCEKTKKDVQTYLPEGEDYLLGLKDY